MLSLLSTHCCSPNWITQRQELSSQYSYSPSRTCYKPMSACTLALLQIMESLGGDQLWFDRFLAEHAAIVYYWVLIVMYMLSPKDAYAFSELVEWHATDTYTQVWQWVVAACLLACLQLV